MNQTSPSITEKSQNPLSIQLDKHLNLDDHFRNYRPKLTSSTITDLVIKMSTPKTSSLYTKTIIFSKIQYSMLPFTVTSPTNQHKLQLRIKYFLKIL